MTLVVVGKTRSPEKGQTMFSQVADGSPPVRDCDSELRVRENKREWEQTGTTCKSREATEDRREKSSRRRLRRRRRALHSGQLSRCQLPGRLWWWPFSTDGHATASVSIGCIACQRTLPPTSLSLSQSVSWCYSPFGALRSRRVSPQAIRQSARHTAGSGITSPVHTLWPLALCGRADDELLLLLFQENWLSSALNLPH